MLKRAILFPKKMAKFLFGFPQFQQESHERLANALLQYIPGNTGETYCPCESFTILMRIV